MSPDQLLAIVLFAFAASGTPGPNTLMLMASGVNFGFRRTLPHMAGIIVGFSVMLVLVGVGLAAVFTLWPPLARVMQVAAVVYMLWLAWKIARSAPAAEGQAPGRPFGFWQAAGFQWINPKGWAIALSAVAIHAPGQQLLPVLLLSGIFALVNVPCAGLWTGVGVALRHWLADPVRLRIFNWTMAGLLVLSLWPVLGMGGGQP